MTGGLSSTAAPPPCVTVCPPLPAFTVMSPLLMSHSAASADTGRLASSSARSVDTIFFFSCAKASFVALIDRLDSFITCVAVKAYQKARPAHESHGQSAPDICCSGLRKRTELFCLSDCLIMGDEFHAVKPLSPKNVLFSWRLPPRELPSPPARVNPYTQSFYQTMRKLSRTCSDKRCSTTFGNPHRPAEQGHLCRCRSCLRTMRMRVHHHPQGSEESV